MSSCDVPQDIICRLIINPDTGQPISKPTLHKHFREELDGRTGKLTTAAAVRRLGRDMLSDENRGTRAATFWLRTREREIFAERRISENRDASENPPAERLTPEDRERVARSVLEQLQSDRENQ